MLDYLVSNQVYDSVIRKLKPMGIEYLHQWQQGEFHHDVVLRLKEPSNALPGDVLVISTTCTAGVKEILCLNEVPDRWALWNYRCPDNPDFEGEMPEVLDSVRTLHWFDPCEMLVPDTRSEYRDEYKRRQRGGGWVHIDSDEE